MRKIVLFFLFLLLLSYSCPYSTPPISLPCPVQPSLPKTIPSPLSLSMGPLYMFPSFPPLSCSPLPSGPCLFVLYFHVSGYILLICFVDYIPLTGEIIWYLSLQPGLFHLA